MSDDYKIPTPTPERVTQTDPSVREGPLNGQICGEVPLEVTMRKPQAYKCKDNSD